MPQWETVIGLEVHAQVSTRTKMFCGCDNDAWGKPPNTTVCPVCMGHPGSLPVPNATAIEKALRASLALGCTVAPECHFDRKHYFYPDLPSGFQISQFDFPLAQHGCVEYDILDASGALIERKPCGITRLHMENDAGKLTHRGRTTLCDYNRAGTPLMEIVTEPDLRSATEAVAFAQALRRILIAVEASEADMFKGMMRFDASISLREVGSSDLNPRSEIKNLNSFKSLEKALQYEERRLRRLWEEEGGPLARAITVGWMDDEEATRVLRDKESSDDYRYFPEPDIPPLTFDDATVDTIRAALPPLPAALRERYEAQGLDAKQAMQLIDEPRLRHLFEAVCDRTDAKRAVGIVLTQLVGFLNAAEKTLDDAPEIDDMIELVDAMRDGKISGNAGKDVLEKMIRTGKRAGSIIEEEGMGQIDDDTAIEELVRVAMDANPQAMESYRAGKQAALGAVVGWVMKESKGQANPQKVNGILQRLAGESAA